uniref:RRM domain-containing protein n=1 Tax=Heterorhabditis bacteriophora TaxID=37862 RepID=A0A1I7XQN7_HETBA
MVKQLTVGPSGSNLRIFKELGSGRSKQVYSMFAEVQGSERMLSLAHTSRGSIMEGTAKQQQEDSASEIATTDKNFHSETSASTNGSMEHVPVKTATASNLVVEENIMETEKDNDPDNRSFRIKGLKHPGGWRTNSEIINLLARCESFNILFEKADRIKGPKPGSIFLTFDAVSSARDAYTQAQKIRVDGITVQVEASDVFFEPAACTSRQYFSKSLDESIRRRTLFALHLPASTDKELLDSIFGTDVIEHVEFLPLTNQQQQAEKAVNLSGLNINDFKVRMCTPEQAASARQDVDKFELDDGVQQSVMRLCTPSEYTLFVEQERKPRPFVPPTVELQVQSEKKRTSSLSEITAEEQLLAPEIDEEDVTDCFIKHVDDHRINWAELTEKGELYEMCDIISGQFGGLPDSILKPAMLRTLQRHLSESQTHWMKEHIESLIKAWKTEVASDELFRRPTLVQMKAADYKPVPNRKRKYIGKNSAQSRAARVVMGVGAILSAARNKFATESGEIDIDEDDAGNIIIGGEALSFESWAKLTKTKQSDIVRSNVHGEEKNLRRKTREEHEFKLLKSVIYFVLCFVLTFFFICLNNNYVSRQSQQKEWREKKMGAKKMRIMQKAREEMEELEKAEREAKKMEREGNKIENGKESCTDEIEKQIKELDEGEIDSDEDKNSKKRKKNMGSSSSSSSSSESEDDGDARKRRRNRRKAERKKGPQLPPLFQNMFDHRQAIINALSHEHKKAFVSILHQLRNHILPLCYLHNMAETDGICPCNCAIKEGARFMMQN